MEELCQACGNELVVKQNIHYFRCPYCKRLISVKRNQIKTKIFLELKEEEEEENGK